MKSSISKNILIAILVVTGVTSLFSCKKFLEERQVASLTQDYYNNEAGLDALINGLYVISRVKHEWDANGARLIEPDGDAYMSVDANFARYNAGAYGSDVSSVAGNVYNFLGSANSSYAPMGNYPHINNCNIALDIIDNVRPGRFGSDDTYRRMRRSEILMLRAWAYYMVSNQLGPVPLLLEPKRQDDGIYYYPKASLPDIYTQIISDMRFAYENLPTSADRGRLTKWAAGHFLAKLYLNRAQAAGWANSPENHLKMLYKGNVATDLDSVITITSAVITGKGGAAGLAQDYFTLFDPKVSEGSGVSGEVLWAAQFDITTGLNGRFGGNRSVNYHTGDYTFQTGVTRSMAYGRPFARFKPTDWGYDNFRDKINDSRFYKTFQYEYISNMPLATSSSYTWTAAAAAWWNANKPAGAPSVVAGTKRILPGTRALIYLENHKDDALDSAMVMSQPFQFLVRWVRSAATGRYYYRLSFDQVNMGLATNRLNIYLSSKKYVDPARGGSTDESNFNSEAGTRDAILMRLAETFLIRAEAYGRMGNFAMAVQDINVVRQRAAYKSGETRPDVLVQWEPKAATDLTAAERVPPYSANGTSAAKLMITENVFTPGSPEAMAQGYIPTVTSKEQMFIHFIYDEKAREFLSEGIGWGDLHNAGLLYDRTVYLNQMASDKTGLWPVAFNTDNGNGQDGNGKGQMKKEYTFRPWPNAFLVQLTNENGNALDAAARAAYQNPGY